MLGLQYKPYRHVQALLTVGEKSISVALQGQNTSAARRLLKVLMQSDLVAPLLVAGSSVRTSAHVQECLLRLQLQKLQYQLAMYSEEEHTLEPAKPKVNAGVRPSLDSLLPADLLDDLTPSTARKSAMNKPQLAVTSSGLQPLTMPAAVEQLWNSICPCMQPGAPLVSAISRLTHMHATHHSARTALAACAQQLSNWSLHAATDYPSWQPPWLSDMQAVLGNDVIVTVLRRQLLGSDTHCELDNVDFRALLAYPAAQTLPALSTLVSAAVSSGNDLSAAWLRFADWLYSRVRLDRHARKHEVMETAQPVDRPRFRRVPLTESDELCYTHISLAYARVLSLSVGRTHHLRLLLRLLHFVIHHKDGLIVAALQTALKIVPPGAWEVLAPQLFVQLHHSQPHVRACATQLLAALSKPAPAAVLYALVAKAWDKSDGGASVAFVRVNLCFSCPRHMPIFIHGACTPLRCGLSAYLPNHPDSVGEEGSSPEIQSLLHAVSLGHPQRVPECRALLAGLRHITLLAAEEWQVTLHATVVEIRRRLITLKSEAERIKVASAMDEASGAVLWQRRYSTLLAHAVSNLRHLLQVHNAAVPKMLDGQRNVISDVAIGSRPLLLILHQHT
jgi:hypothetical protein